ncbi:MAG: O-antigen ligase family protein [Prosthecobacter sp.]
MNSAAATISRAWSPAVPWRGRYAAAQIAVGGYLAGFSILPNEWFHLGCLALSGAVALGKPRDFLESPDRRSDAGPWIIGAFLAWMTLRSLLTEAAFEGQGRGEVVRGLIGTALLVLFSVLTWTAARDRSFLKAAAWVTSLPAAFATLISLLLTCCLLPGHQAGERLTNLLVHGGLNPVCTGLIFGFSALWLAVRAADASLPLPRGWVWFIVALLHLAAFMSGSRGAMLALACGHAALLTAQGWQRGKTAAAVFLLTGLVYFAASPLWQQIASRQATPVRHRPFQEAIARGDNGRLEIYRAGWNAVANPWLGTGQWGVRETWQRELRPESLSVMIHLHSGFFATFVHGGLIGLSLLIALLALAWHRACRVALEGDAAWIALLAFGCGGLLFDGESLTSLATAPRFEGLLFWLPIIVALERGGLTSPPAGS